MLADSWTEEDDRILNIAVRPSYQDIAVILGVPIQGEHLAKDVGYLLGEISEDEVLNGRPMLSAVCSAPRKLDRCIMEG
jgi:hypothetical protein